MVNQGITEVQIVGRVQEQIAGSWQVNVPEHVAAQEPAENLVMNFPFRSGVRVSSSGAARRVLGVRKVGRLDV